MYLTFYCRIVNELTESDHLLFSLLPSWIKDSKSLTLDEIKWVAHMLNEPDYGYGQMKFPAVICKRKVYDWIMCNR